MTFPCSQIEIHSRYWNHFIPADAAGPSRVHLLFGSWQTWTGARICGWLSFGASECRIFGRAIVAGLLAGYVVEALKRIPRYIRLIMPILVILSSGFIGIVMLKVLGIPIAHMMNFAIAALKSMSTGNTVILALLLGP